MKMILGSHAYIKADSCKLEVVLMFKNFIRYYYYKWCVIFQTSLASGTILAHVKIINKMQFQSNSSIGPFHTGDLLCR